MTNAVVARALQLVINFCAFDELLLRFFHDSILVLIFAQALGVKIEFLDWCHGRAAAPNLPQIFRPTPPGENYLFQSLCVVNNVNKSRGNRPGDRIAAVRERPRQPGRSNRITKVRARVWLAPHRRAC